MFITLQQAFEVISFAAKEKSDDFFAKSEHLLMSIAGWVIMLIGAPYLALTVPNVSIPVTFVCSFFSVIVFFVGAAIVLKYAEKKPNI